MPVSGSLDGAESNDLTAADVPEPAKVVSKRCCGILTPTLNELEVP